LALGGDSARQLAALRLGHRLARVAHANHRHGVQSREERSIRELNVVCRTFYRDVLEAAFV
jgi:hypothetical protein